MTIAGLIWIAHLIHTLYSGEFAEMSAIRKGTELFLGVLGVYSLWLAWSDRTPVADDQR